MLFLYFTCLFDVINDDDDDDDDISKQNEYSAHAHEQCRMQCRDYEPQHHVATMSCSCLQN